VVRPVVRREVVRHLQGAYGVGERRACSATGFRRSSQRYRSRRDPQVELRMRLRDLAASRVRYGYRRLHVLLRREGWPVNAKRVYRLYAEEGLTIRSKVPRRKRAWRYRVGRPRAVAPNEVWSMDFVADALFDGRPIRILAVIDAHTREALSIAPRVNFRAFDVVAELDCLARQRGRPKTLKVDNWLCYRMLAQACWRNSAHLPSLNLGSFGHEPGGLEWIGTPRWICSSSYAGSMSSVSGRSREWLRSSGCTAG
jgi:putative transposase